MSIPDILRELAAVLCIFCAGCGAVRPYPKVGAPPNFERKCFNDHYEYHPESGLCELKEGAK